MGDPLQIKIESILGGIGPSPSFMQENQFQAALGIDPGLPINDGSSPPSGLLRPVAVKNVSASTMAAAPMWILDQPKESIPGIYVYDSLGSVYTSDLASMTALNDGGSMVNARGNGAAYYDNYMYFAKNTTIARYGPLNGSPVFDGNYWTSTLAKTALNDTQYPDNVRVFREYPNHVMHRHSDGRLYIADVQDNKGVLHYIKTKKTTVEGDTDDGSMFQVLQFGYGLWPTAIESYGSDLVIALADTSDQSPNDHTARAKIAFWDTTSANFNKITWVEFPDSYISALKNVNGVLYTISGNKAVVNMRVSRFIGGYTFEEVFYVPFGAPSFPGAVWGTSERLFFGSFTSVPTQNSCVFSLGLQSSSLGRGIFNVARTTKTGLTAVTAIKLYNNSAGSDALYVGWANSSEGSENVGVDITSCIDTGNINYSNAECVWWSQIYKIGQPFQIKRIRIPMGQAMGANMTVIPKLIFDNGTKSQVLPTLNSTNFPNGEFVCNLKTAGDGANIIMGQHNFYLELKWTGSALATVNLPITIDLETIPD